MHVCVYFCACVRAAAGDQEKRRETGSKYGNAEKTRKPKLSHGFVSTCVVAQTLSLLSPPVEPDAEAHQNDPAGPTDARDEGRLLHDVRDLLRDAVVPVSAHDHVPEVFTCANTHTQENDSKVETMSEIVEELENIHAPANIRTKII